MSEPDFSSFGPRPKKPFSRVFKGSLHGRGKGGGTKKKIRTERLFSGFFRVMKVVSQEGKRKYCKNKYRIKKYCRHCKEKSSSEACFSCLLAEKSSKRLNLEFELTAKKIKRNSFISSFRHMWEEEGGEIPIKGSDKEDMKGIGKRCVYGTVLL